MSKIGEFNTIQQWTERVPQSAAIAQSIQWIETFVAAEGAHPRRTSALCLWAKHSLEQGILYLAEAHSGTEEDELISIVHSLPKSFAMVEDIHKRATAPVALCVVFVDQNSEEFCSTIDKIHQRIKPILIEQSLMLGHSHRFRHRASRARPRIFTMRSPYPMFIIRRTVLQDAVLLSSGQPPNFAAIEAFNRWRSSC